MYIHHRIKDPVTHNLEMELESSRQEQQILKNTCQALDDELLHVTKQRNDLQRRIEENATAPLPQPDNRLINMLYHEIARLERTVQDGVGLMMTFEEYLLGIDTERNSLDFIQGLLQQYMDTHNAN